MTDDIIIKEAIRLVNEGVSVTLPVKGRSMLPFIIDGKDSVILQKPDGAKVGDVVLAWVNGCHYVVHRIIRIDDNQVTLMGDGNIVGTEWCGIDDVKARATHVVDAKGRTHDLYDRRHRWAAKIWFWLCPVRRYLLAIYRRVAGIERVKY